MTSPWDVALTCARARDDARLLVVLRHDGRQLHERLHRPVDAVDVVLHAHETATQ